MPDGVKYFRTRSVGADCIFSCRSPSVAEMSLAMQRFWNPGFFYDEIQPGEDEGVQAALMTLKRAAEARDLEFRVEISGGGLKCEIRKLNDNPPLA